MKKPAWVVDREREDKEARQHTIWLFGLHAVEDALRNPARDRRRLILTRNAMNRLADAVAASGMEPEIADARRFPAPLARDSVHQGAALEVRPLDWGPLASFARPEPDTLLVLLDRVTDPHNVGAVLRSAEVFGAAAVVAPLRHSAPETGALAKAASGALERQPYLRVRNLADAMIELKERGFHVIGLDGTAPLDLARALTEAPAHPLALVLGAEGPGLRARTRATCDSLARIEGGGGFQSLNISNAAAVALYAARAARTGGSRSRDTGFIP